MALNPIAYTERVVRSFLRYQLTAYPFADPRLHTQMRELLSLGKTRLSPLLKGPYVSLSRPFRQGASIEALIDEGLLHPLLRQRIPSTIQHAYGHQERAIRAIAAGRATLVSTGTGSGKTECFLYPIVSRCLRLRDDGAAPGISAVIVYPMNALAEDQLARLRGLLAGTRIPFGIYVGKTPEFESRVEGIRLPAGSSHSDYQARLDQARRVGRGETVHPAEEVCSREAMRRPGGQPRILLTNVKQLELLLTRQRDIELFADVRLDFLVFDEAHTFTGALGAETACLIRRLCAYAQAAPSATTFIATSATIVDPNDSSAGRKFAARFFGVAPDTVATVGEDHVAEVWREPRRVPVAPEQDPFDLLDRAVQAVEDQGQNSKAVRSAYRALAGEELAAGDWQQRLYFALSQNEIVYRLSEELKVPKALASLPPVLEVALGRPVPEAEVLAWLTLGAAARHDGRPLLRPVVHCFVRGIGGAVVSFPEDAQGPVLWLAAADSDKAASGEKRIAHFPVSTCTTCGQHYYVTFLDDFTFSENHPGGGNASPAGSYWDRQAEAHGGSRVVLVDSLIGYDNGIQAAQSHKRTSTLHFCRVCGAAHARNVRHCQACGHVGSTVQLQAVRQDKKVPGVLTSCLSCSSTGKRIGGRYREPARPVRAVNVADVHVLAQDMVNHAQRERLLVFCDNRQDAAFQAGWMKDHARRFRLRALMAEQINVDPISVGDLVAHLDETLENDKALSLALIPEVWQVARPESAGRRHQQERRKYIRFQVLREVALAARQTLGLEPWGRMKVEYEGLGTHLPWIQEQAQELSLYDEEFCEGVASVVDYLRRRRILHDPEYETFTKNWMDGDREVQQGYLPKLHGPVGTKLRREYYEKSTYVVQWCSAAGQTAIRQIVGKWQVPAEHTIPFLEGLFAFLIEIGLLVPVQLKGARGRPLPNVSGVYQVNTDRLLLCPNTGFWRCKSCRRSTTRRTPYDLCAAWRCKGSLEWVEEDEDNYNLQLLEKTYSMLRPEEHTAMVPPKQRERLENLFKGASEAVNCLVCTPTLELGIDIGRLDSVLMRNVPPLPANYWQRAGRAGRRHRMAVDLTYCRPVSHDRAYFAEPVKLLDGHIDPPAFNLRNDVMIAKHVHATIIGTLHRYSEDPSRTESERSKIRETMRHCLPRRVEPYLFKDGIIRDSAFDFAPIGDLVKCHAEDLAVHVETVFRNGWPKDAVDGFTDPASLRTHINRFSKNLELVVARLRRRLLWAMAQIKRLNKLRELRGTLERDDEALYRRCVRLVNRLKGIGNQSRSRAEGHDGTNTFGVLAAEGFLPGYGLEIGSIVGWAEIPFWHTGSMDFSLPRPPATALREYVPGNLIYANGHRFVARRFHRKLQDGSTSPPGTTEKDESDIAVYEVSVAHEAVRAAESGTASGLGASSLKTIPVCDTDLMHTSHISDEEELRFQLGVAIYGTELDQHSGGKAFGWGSQPVHLRQGVRLRLVNVGTAGGVEALRRGGSNGKPAGKGPFGNLGYPLCTVCGQSVSPLSSQRQHESFHQTHSERCGRVPESIGFYADVTADALSLPSCDSPKVAYSVLEALRFGTTQVLDMHMGDLQILVMGHVGHDKVDACLWDPMPGGSGLLDQLIERFGDVTCAALEVVSDCPSRCESSCIDCLQTFRNTYYHRHLDRNAARERFEKWGTTITFAHEIASKLPAKLPDLVKPQQGLPVNEAETKLRHLLLSAGFDEGTRGEQIQLGMPLGTTTPDIVFRAADDESDEGMCVYLDGLSEHIHGNPKRAAKDQQIRTWLRTKGYEVLEITAHELDDENAMVRHFQRLARYLGKRKLKRRVRADRSWFHKPGQNT